VKTGSSGCLVITSPYTLDNLLALRLHGIKKTIYIDFQFLNLCISNDLAKKII
jgi:hypothetical protein